MIDLAKENVQILRDAAASLPRRRNGKHPHPNTLRLWGKNGYHGVFLEVVQVGDTMCTSAEALQRFFEALTIQALNGTRTSSSSPEAKRDQQEVEQRLKEMGL